MTTEPIRISVIIVNYGTPQLAIEAVQSVLERSHHGHQVDVHLLDNASPGNDAEQFAEAFAGNDFTGRVTLYPEAENHGFGRGNNIVLSALAQRAEPPDMVMLLNPDARLENEAIGVMADFLAENAEFAAVGPAISKPDGTKVTAAFRFPGATAEFVQALSFGPVRRLFRHKDVPLPADHPELQVDWVAGAAPLIRFSAVRDIGFFDPVFFLYYEEVDLMRRLGKKGWKIGYLKDARVIHAEGAATGVRSGKKRPDRLPQYWYHSWSHYYLKNHGRGGALVAAVAFCSGCGLNLLLSYLAGRVPKTPPRFFGDFWKTAGRKIVGLKTE